MIVCIDISNAPEVLVPKRQQFERNWQRGQVCRTDHMIDRSLVRSAILPDLPAGLCMWPAGWVRIVRSGQIRRWNRGRSIRRTRIRWPYRLSERSQIYLGVDARKAGA